MSNSNRIQFSVIIPNYNGALYLPDCLNSLIDNIDKSQTDFEIILVDNNSHDNSIEVFNHTFASRIITRNYHTKVIQLDANYGFAGAVNRGIQVSSYDYVVLLNNDLVITKDWFSLVKEEILNSTDHKLAAVAGTVLSKDGQTFESQGLYFEIKGKCTNISNGLPFLKSEICHLKSSYIWGASAALIVYKKDILTSIGCFDEKFFAYEEDVDVALRLHKLGYKTLYVPQAISYHLGGGTSKKMGNFRNYHDYKNWIYIIIKNYSVREILTNFISIKIERWRNLSGFIKATIRLYGLRSIYLLPRDLVKLLIEIFSHLPQIFQDRAKFHNLLKSIQ